MGQGQQSNKKNAWPWAVQPLGAAIVDLDGTLADTVGDFVAALQAMLADLPTPFSSYIVAPALVEQLVGKGSENLIKSLLELIGRALAATESIADELFPLALESYQRHYAQINGRHARVYPGVVEGLQQMRARGWRLACVTNKPTVAAQQLLRHLGLEGFFEFTLGGDALAHKKPHPLPLWTACERLGTAPALTLMVGDSSNDAQAARAAGCPVLLVTYGYNHGQPIRGVDADAFADSLAELPCLPAASVQKS